MSDDNHIRRSGPGRRRTFAAPKAPAITKKEVVRKKGGRLPVSGSAESRERFERLKNTK